MVMAGSEKGRVFKIKDLAKEIGASKGYLAKCITPLPRFGILKTSTDLKGGLSLAKPPGNITLLEVCRALRHCADKRRKTGSRQRRAGVGRRRAISNILDSDLVITELEIRLQLSCDTILNSLTIRNLADCRLNYAEARGEVARVLAPR